MGFDFSSFHAPKTYHVFHLPGIDELVPASAAGSKLLIHLIMDSQYTLSPQWNEQGNVSPLGAVVRVHPPGCIMH